MTMDDEEWCPRCLEFRPCSGCTVVVPSILQCEHPDFDNPNGHRPASRWVIQLTRRGVPTPEPNITDRSQMPWPFRVEPWSYKAQTMCLGLDDEAVGQCEHGYTGVTKEEAIELAWDIVDRLRDAEHNPEDTAMWSEVGHQAGEVSERKHALRFILETAERCEREAERFSLENHSAMTIAERYLARNLRRVAEYIEGGYHLPDTEEKSDGE